MPLNEDVNSGLRRGVLMTSVAGCGGLPGVGCRSGLGTPGKPDASHLPAPPGSLPSNPSQQGPSASTLNAGQLVPQPGEQPCL